MKIGIIDADLLDGGTNYPNLALMKISGYQKSIGNTVKLILDYNEVNNFEKLFMSKVFTSTKIPEEILNMNNINIGGTGFYFDKAPSLPHEIEHHMPDYDLYNTYVDKEIERGMNRKQLEYYTDYSIGFTSRGCMRGCQFCVNKNSKGSRLHSPLNEFYNPERKKVTLWDDNVLACKDWENIFKELQATGKRFKYKQGLDFRLLTREKMEVLKTLKYDGDFIFAFDNIKDKTIIEEKLKLWNEIIGKQCRFYVFCGFENLDMSKDIEDLFERIKILMKYKHVPYIMRHENYNTSKHKKLYINIARWCNQPSFYKKKSFREFAELNQSNIKTEGKLCSCMSALVKFENEYPEIAKRYFDMKFIK